MTLYELTQEARYLYDLLSQGEIDEQTVADSLEGMNWQEDFEKKCESYGMVIKSLEADAVAAKTESDRLATRAKSFSSNAAEVRKRLYEAMKALNHEKIKTPLFNFAIQQNPVSVSIADGAVIPTEYMRITESPDKTAIKSALEKGMVIQGCELTRSESLRIR